MSFWRKRLARATTALLLAMGISLAWAFLLTTLAETLWQASLRRVTFYEELAVREDGVPLVVANDSQTGQQQIRRLDGTPLDSTESRRQIAGAYLWPIDGYSASWSERVLAVSAIDDPTSWYFLHTGRADGLGYFGWRRPTMGEI